MIMGTQKNDNNKSLTNNEPGIDDGILVVFPNSRFSFMAIARLGNIGSDHDEDNDDNNAKFIVDVLLMHTPSLLLNTIVSSTWCYGTFMLMILQIRENRLL
jgi:hypothetical protein